MAENGYHKQRECASPAVESGHPAGSGGRGRIDRSGRTPGAAHTQVQHPGHGDADGQASFAAVRPLLAESQTVVGYEVNVKHLAPAGVGSLVTGRSTLTDVSGNKLRFEVVARLDDVILGTAEHKMAVVPQTE